MLTLLSAILQSGLLATPLGQLLLALVGVAIVIVVLRFVLSIAWRLVTIAAVVVGIVLILSIMGFF